MGLSLGCYQTHSQHKHNNWNVVLIIHLHSHIYDMIKIKINVTQCIFQYIYTVQKYSIALKYLHNQLKSGDTNAILITTLFT